MKKVKIHFIGGQFYLLGYDQWQVTSNGGAPGASSQIRIRGLSSLNSNNAPLIVIDGVILPSNTDPSGTTSDGTSTVAGLSNPLDLLNPAPHNEEPRKLGVS